MATLVRLLIVLLLAFPAIAQTCASQVSPTSMSFSVPLWGPTGPAQAFTLTPSGGGTWSVADSSHITLRNGANPPVSSGTGNDTVYAYVHSGYTGSPTTLTDTVTFIFNGTQSCGVTITTTVGARNTPILSNNAGVVDSALPHTSSTGGWITPNDKVDQSFIGSLPGGSYQLPAVGGPPSPGFLEPIYNTRIYNCSPSNYVVNYSTNMAMNPDDTFIFMQGVGAAPRLVSWPGCVDNAVTGILHPMQANELYWDRSGPNNVAYYMPNDTSGTIRKLVIDLTTFVATDTLFFTQTGATKVSNGSTDDLAVDNWWTFYTDKDSGGSTAHPQACWINMGTATSYCIDMSLDYPAIVGKTPNFTLGSQGCSSFTNKRYLIVGSVGNSANVVGYGPLYSMPCNGGAITFVGFMPVSTENNRVPRDPAMSYTDTTCTSTIINETSLQGCTYTGSHSSMGRSADGHVYWLADEFSTIVNHFSVISYDLDVPTNLMGKAVASGGGRAFAMPMISSPATGSCQGDWCITHSTPSDLTSWNILNVVNNGVNIDITLSSAPGQGLVTGDPADIVKVTGCTVLNKLPWFGGSVVVSGSTLTIVGQNCNSAWTGGGIVYRNTYPVNNTSYRFEAMAIHLGNSGQVTEVHRIGSTLSAIFSNGEHYYTIGQMSMSMDKKWVVFNTTWGKEGDLHVSVMPTGISGNTPSLVITKSHIGNFVQNQSGATYSISVENVGNGATDGTTVTVTDTVPAGLTLVSMAGIGWSCAANVCTRSDTIGANAFYPTITATVNVALNATSPQVNNVSVSGGGSASASGSDSTVITSVSNVFGVFSGIGIFTGIGIFR